MALEMLLNVYLRQQWHAVGPYLAVHTLQTDPCHVKITESSTTTISIIFIMHLWQSTSRCCTDKVLRSAQVIQLLRVVVILPYF